MTKGLTTGENLNDGARSVGLPPRPFLYTIDQLSVLLDITETLIRQKYLYFDRRSIGRQSPDLIMVHNISPVDRSPDWRISERELVRWMKRKGFRYYERASIRG